MILRNTGIKSWSEDDRPREKLIQKGPGALSDAELLAILISGGTREKTALDLARETLSLIGNNLNQLGKLNIIELQKIKGVGEARSITIAAAMELGRRRQLSRGLERQTLSDVKQAIQILMPLLQDLNYEVFCVLYLNTAQYLIKHEIIS